MSEGFRLPDPLPPRRRAHDVRELPDRILQTYSRLWQLETWLRLMVYVELKARMGDSWMDKVKLAKTEGSQKADKAVGPEFSSQLIMLKESFRQVMICRHEPGYIFRDLLPDGCVAFSPFPTARGRCASPSALRVPGDAAASAYFIE